LKILVIRSEEGKIVESKVIDSDLAELVKSITQKALDEWNPASSDFTVLRAKYEIRYKLPIKPELVDIARDLGLDMMREGNELIVQVPIYTISFDNEWMDDSYTDRKMYIVALYLDDEGRKQIEEYAVETTKGPKKIDYGSASQLSLSAEELKALEEGLKELEQEEKPKRTRGRRKRKR
jgi:hypothetical protein